MSPEGPSIFFRRAEIGLPRRQLRAFAQQLMSEVTGGRAFDCLLTDDKELQRLNNSFLGRDYPTDVLSFPSGMNGGFAGEIAISTNRASAQSKDHGHTPEEEIRILMLHGVLHLLGMDHEKDRGAMARAEKRWRKHYGLPLSLTERGKA